MKKVILLVFSMTFAILTLNAQKVGYLNTETILKEIPEYIEAQAQLQAMGEKYKAGFEAEYKAIEALYNAYQADKSALSSANRQSRENEIIIKERELKEKQNAIFGQEGTMTKESQKLIDPIKLKIQTEIDNFAREHSYSLILDISSNMGVVYKNENDDLSKKIIERYNMIYR